MSNLLKIASKVRKLGGSKELFCKLAFAHSAINIRTASGMVPWVKRELELAGLFDKDSDYEGMLGNRVLDIVKLFCEQGHSGGSASLSLSLLDKLLRYKPLTSLGNPTETGDYKDMSMESGSPCWQSTRDFSVFSHDEGKTWEKMVEDLYEERLDENCENPYKKGDDSYGKYMTYTKVRFVPLKDWEAGKAGPVDHRKSDSKNRI
jgi:hypothetical protein